jgi:16S rRNA (uracil1498-N3)-methyltransferase
MKKTPRLFLNPEAFAESEVTLSKGETHYLSNVLRLRTGDQFAALDGRGKAWLCTLDSSASASKVGEFPARPCHPLALTVAVALCKGSRFEGVIEKVAELGGAVLIPLLTKRTERKPPSQAKLDRWKEIALSSSALAYRRIPLKIAPPTPLEELDFEGASEFCFCHPGGLAPASYFSSISQSLTLVIGPEGGLSPAEVETLQDKASMVGLGPYNLRVETAATVACGMALNLYRNKPTSKVQ